MAAAFAVCACILVVNLIGGSANSLAALPEGLRRIHESMLISNLSATFYSRTAFWEIGWNIWLDNLLFGAGFERFRMLTSEYASQLGLGLGTWVDNSNNFYLGVLAELGIIGAASLALSLRPLTFKIGEYDSLLRAPVAAFLFLLLFGPHLSFDEVAVLFALILGLNCSINLPQFGSAKSVAALAVVALIALKASQLPRGIYAWEKEGELSVRWTARSAQMLFRCSREGLAHLRVRALNPDADANPVTGKVTSSLGEIKGFQLRTNEWASLNLACPVLQSAALDSISMPISIEVSRIWTPRKFGLGADRRRLGVQITAP
jgi:hypothetical protein